MMAKTFVLLHLLIMMAIHTYSRHSVSVSAFTKICIVHPRGYSTNTFVSRHTPLKSLRGTIFSLLYKRETENTSMNSVLQTTRFRSKYIITHRPSSKQQRQLYSSNNHDYYHNDNNEDCNDTNDSSANVNSSNYNNQNKNNDYKNSTNRQFELLMNNSLSRAIRTISTLNTIQFDGTNGNDQQDFRDYKSFGRRDIYSGRNVDNDTNDALNFNFMKVKMDDDVTNDQSNPTSSKIPSSSSFTQNNSNTQRQKQHQDKRTYLSNPSVTATALAHTLWKQVIRPYNDIVIDATCGNGKDAVALCQMLFPNNYHDDNDNDNDDDDTNRRSKLICIDIQSRACQNTMESLQSTLESTSSSSSSTLIDFQKYVSVINASHSPLLPILDSVFLGSDADGSSSTTSNEEGNNINQNIQGVGLVCYNLGYLPGGGGEESYTLYSSSSSSSSSELQSYKNKFTTQMETTIHSLSDAALSLRVGGLLSVMTYPGTNLKESIAVSYFCEGLAMFTTRDEGGWEGFVDGIRTDDEISLFHYHGNNNVVDVEKQQKTIDHDDTTQKDEIYSIQELIRTNLQRVKINGGVKQTWRVFEHKPLGRPLSPILVTAMRIK